MASSDSPRVVAFYLPQFHAIPENDQWWGIGFTEWHNVRRAEPLFDAHDHPRVPRELGYYDLSNIEVIAQQAELSRQAGVDAWCIYFYWFDHDRLLQKPLDMLMASSIDQPFCLSWANENWTRRWDGKAHEVLKAQVYGPSTADDVFSAWLPYLRDGRYLTVRGRPVVVVHKVQDLPDARGMAERWRRRAVNSGFTGLHLVAAETAPGLDPRVIGFDALAEFPPVGSNDLRSAMWRSPAGLARRFRGRLFSYQKIAQSFVRRRPSDFPRHRGVMPAWDNTARRGPAATIYVGADPESYQWWLARAIDAERAERGGDGLVFINAWNEWAEGAYLEPDDARGLAWVTATRRAVDGDMGRLSTASFEEGRLLHKAQLRSLGLAGAASARRHMQAARGRLAQNRRPGSHG